MCVTMHALHDPTVNFKVEAMYAATVAAAGRSDLLVQVATDEDKHSKLSDAGYMTALDALEGWIDSGKKPERDRFQARCEANWARLGKCLFITPYPEASGG